MVRNQIVLPSVYILGSRNRVPMPSKPATPLSRQIMSDPAIWLFSVLAGLSVFALAIFIQWLIYNDWLHDHGPVRVVGSTLAAALTIAGVWRWQLVVRQRKLEMLRRFETIKWMTDRIRNSLQAIECVTYAASREATEPVRIAVDVIEGVLDEVLAEHHPGARQAPRPIAPGGAVIKAGAAK